MAEKSKKHTKARIAEKLKQQNPKIFCANILFIVLFVVVILLIIQNFEKIDRKKEELEHLQKVEDSLRIRNEELEARIQMEVDYEYIERAAKEMGYRNPNSTIFHVYSE